jgi:hypothetical protein
MQQTAIYNPQWGCLMDIDKPLFDHMAAAGYTPQHTGGGCMVWERARDGGSYMLTAESVEPTGIGLWQDRHLPVWTVGRYDDEGNWVVVHDVPLYQAIRLADLLPPPDPEDCQRDMRADEFLPPHAARMDTREALSVARDMLERRAAETEAADPEGHLVRCAIDTLDALLAQRGCEHFDAGGDGSLTNLCDVIVFG